MSKELKPCPFCGSSDVMYMSWEHGNGTFMMCRNCKASTRGRLSDEAAERAWNKRRKCKLKGASRTCSKCGVNVSRFAAWKMMPNSEHGEAEWLGARFCPFCGAEVVSE